MVEERRSLGMYILLSLVTCGIYSFFWFYKFAQDMNTVCNGDGDNTPGLGSYILFNILTCGIYSFFWYYKVGNRQAANGPRYGLHIQDDGKSILVWLLLGSLLAGIGVWIALYMMIRNINMLAHAYNTSGGNNNGSYNNKYNNSYNTPNVNATPVNNDYNPVITNTDYTNNFDMSKTAPINTLFDTPLTSISIQGVTGEFQNKAFSINANGKLVIGRELSCDIKFNSTTPNVSRKHCTVSYDGNTVWLTDNSSSFGTFLDNGTKLVPEQRVALSKGNGFYLGNRDISFTIV